MFTWSPFDMLGIDPDIICHWLHVNPASKPVVQNKHNFAPERVVIIEAEIDKLLVVEFIEEVSYSEWLANVVLVAKQEKGKWKVCVDYTDLNKACLKDNFPLPRIDQLLDSTSGNQLLRFMDAYSDYNQIMMYDDDKAKTSFIIERGTYCYKVTPFGLTNGGATYQRLVNTIFKEHIGRTIVQLGRQLSSHPRRTWGPTSDILHFKSSPRCRDSLPEIREAHFGPCSFHEKAATLLPSSLSHRHDRLSFEINPPQP
ncbi:hypothetical protein L3X38_011495 [Prunus dulcis]|uniref:Reverse transcriptase domain-containing protein n=1 Tax=Prunus dulcis TaxID=3755 RepID=A0AAD4WHW2_PRUDU|nr:hypothetical protein L3X38_011495 [Prunus dulcis]